QGRDVNLDIARVVGYRNFCNKLWNAVRFALTYITDLEPSGALHRQLMEARHAAAPRDRWILSRLNTAVQDCNKCMEEYRFGDFTTAGYGFWLYDLCDVYLELIKPVVNDKSDVNSKARWIAQACLYTCLDYGLKLLHPVMPYVTEELWQRLPGRGNMGPDESPSIMLAPYPQADVTLDDPACESAMGTMKTLIHAGRSLRSTYNIKPSVKADFYIRTSSEERHKITLSQKDDFSTLVKAATTTTMLNEDPPAGCSVHIVDDQTQVHIQLRGLVDFDVEILKLQKQLDTKVETQISSLTKKMEAAGYEEKVPLIIRETNTKKLNEYKAERETILKAMEQFRALMA
ncbi:unnamed protein product, partial [Discosporangium mesarthrocarpum]